MKRLMYLLSVLATLVALVIPALPTVYAAGSTNLIANPSVETDNGSGNPANWTANSWGTNTTTLSWATNGHTGSHSLAINMSAHTSGDAKWMHDAVAVSPNTSYTYASWYKASVATEIDLQYLDTAGNTTYAYATPVPASGNWNQVSTTFTTPANAAKVVVMHILAQAGTLQTDDFTLATTVAPPVDNDNLIPNPSMETINGVMPAGWQHDTWGANDAAFTYENTGHTGTHSVTATITQYTSGDAKWDTTAPQSVVAGKTYTYSDYYKSSVSTRVVAAFQDATGATTYAELDGAAPAANWTQYTTNFTVPANITKVTMYHLLDRVGTLTIDDASLVVAVATAPTFIPNSSAETASPSDPTNMPANWTHNAWGTNSPTFEYINNDGHTGTHSVKLTMNNYTDGDAKWYFNPITTLTPGKQYRFTTWYKTNTTPHAVVMFTDAKGNDSFFGMPNPIPNGTTNWQQYSDTFLVPAGTVKTTAFLLLNNNGWLQTDDVSLNDYSPSGWSRPLLTLTFDDSEEDNVTTALPVLKQYGFKATNYFATTFIENPDPGTDNVANVKTIQKAGWEIGAHTVTHPFLTQVSQTQLVYELTHSQQYLQSITGAPVNNFASPYGDYNENVITEIKKLYRSHRTTDEGYNSKDNFDPYRLRVQNILTTTTAAQVQTWVKQAQADKTWLILVYHRVATDPEPYDTTPTLFKQQMQVIKNSGIVVKTTNAALDEITPQVGH